MNRLFNMDKALLQKVYKNLLAFFALAALLKIGALLLLHFLPAVGITRNVAPFKAPQLFSLDPVKVFGIKAEAAADANKGKMTLAETTYPLTALKLKAIFHSKSLSFVTLDDNGNVVFLDIGQSFKGYTLQKVFPKKAIFVQNGKQFELSLEDEQDQAMQTAAKQPSAPQQEAVQELKNIPRDEIKSYQKDMSKIWSNIGLKEHKNGKELDGFIVTFVKGGSVFDQLGLQKGDILTEANGIKLGSYKDALNLYKKVDTIKVFKLTILRNNEEKELEYEIY